jgi:Domain of unknown function (DUF6894)
LRAVGPKRCQSEEQLFDGWAADAHNEVHMPAYFFHIDSTEEELDDQGTELLGIPEVREQAIGMIAGMLHNGEGASMWVGTPMKLWVTDGPHGTGKTFFTVTVSVS